MKLGYFTMPLHPVGKDWGRTLAEDREAILLADRLGYFRDEGLDVEINDFPGARRRCRR